MNTNNEPGIVAAFAKTPGVSQLWMRCLLLLAALFIWSGSFAADQVTFIHTDLYGSPVAATNDSAEVVWRRHYTPYGEEVLQIDFPRDSVGYTGHLFDNQTDLSYFQARTYDPAVGRFLGVDPVGFDESNIHSFNKYTYANNNPYKYVDPDGRAPTFDNITPFPPSFDDVVNKFAGPVGGGGSIRASSRGSGNNPAAVPKGGGQTFERVVSNAELKATQKTGLLRGGREGENFFTNQASLDAKRAQQRLGLDGPLRDSRVQFRIKNNVEVTGPRRAAPGQTGTAGGGREFSTNGRTEIEILRVDPLRK